MSEQQSQHVGRPTVEEAKEKARLEKNEKISETMSKMDEDHLQKLEEAFAARFTNEQASDQAGISPGTYYNWVKENPELLERFAKAKRILPRVAKRNKAKAIHEGNLSESQKLLEHDEPESYGDITRIEHRGSIDMSSTSIEADTENDEIITEAVHAVEERLRSRIVQCIKDKAKEQHEPVENASEKIGPAESGAQATA